VVVAVVVAVGVAMALAVVLAVAVMVVAVAVTLAVALTVAVDEGQRRWRGRSWGDALVANDDGSGRPLQRPLAHVHGGRDSDKEGGTKATIGGGEWGQKWGCNNDDNEYSADKVASASRTIRQSTMTITTAARRGSGQ
jgi:hypothetical protein